MLRCPCSSSSDACLLHNSRYAICDTSLHAASAWQFDFSKFTLACSVCYSCVSLLPLTVHLMLQRMGFSAPQGLRPSLLKTVSVYGYSLFGFIPVCFLCLIKLAFIRWTAFITGFLLSTYFILRNILNIQDPKLVSFLS